MRQIEFLDAEIAEVERLIARDALCSADARRLMSVPGVNVICAATFLAAIGDIRRFTTSRQLVGYLGLDPKVRQSGSAPARGGRISKQGSPSARWALVEAAWSVVAPARPAARVLRADPRPPRARQIAIVAAARKLAVLFWCLLTREEHYAHQQPSLTAKKLRRLELTAGAPALKGKPHRRLGDQPGDARSRARARPPGRGLLRADGPRLASSNAQEGGRERDTGARITVALEGQTSRGRLTSPRRLLFDTSSARARTTT